MPKAKKFIDRKSAVTFHLVHRSQQDPLAADDTAPQHVLLAARDKRSKEDKTRKEAQQKFGVYFDDDYNYLQHLRAANTISVDWEPVERFRIEKSESVPTKLPGSDAPKPRLNLPSSVFASEVEEKVGLLNKAAPQTGLRLDLDPDVVAAMDEDFNFSDPENELEDNFIELANAETSNLENDSDYEDCSSDECFASDEEDDDEVGSMIERQFADEETKSRFTEYSMTSSVMRRNEQLSILDGRFEHIFAGYEDSEIGALDCDEIEGHVAPDDVLVLQYAEDFKRDRAPEHLSVVAPQGYVGSDSSGDDDFQDLEIPDKNDEKWDCQSILSTYSNIYNHPKLIAEPKGPGKIRVDRRTGIPLGVIDGRDGKLTTGALARHDAAHRSSDDSDDDDDDHTIMSKLSTLSIRPPGETPEQRNERKRALKEYRRERRLERKANTLAFKEEKKRQEKVLLNNTRNKQAVHIV